ncbi:MAG: flagellar biosynthetic protein FliO [Lachnospiraceae bacterium]|nr:flagellar biosynthetic protein FliO [Lachnospiraceae bacterium]
MTDAVSARLLLSAIGVDSAAQFATVLLAFIFVLAITLVGTRLVGNYQKHQSFSKNFETIEGFRLANNKYLQLVRIGERYYVIAVGKDEVTLIAEVPGEELVLPDPAETAGTGFGRILSGAAKKLKDKDRKTDEQDVE